MLGSISLLWRRLEKWNWGGEVAVGQNQWDPILGRCTTHSGLWDVHWGYGDFEPWPGDSWNSLFGSIPLLWGRPETWNWAPPRLWQGRDPKPPHWFVTGRQVFDVSEVLEAKRLRSRHFQGPNLFPRFKGYPGFLVSFGTNLYGNPDRRRMARCT